MDTQYQTLQLANPAPHVTVVTMNRPQAINAMNTQMMLDLHDCFSAFYVDQGDTRCLVLTGAGEKGV